MQMDDSYAIKEYLELAHDKLFEAQRELDNRDLNEQKLLEHALDAVNRARQALDMQLE
jgi:hypothetical protein